MCSSRGHAVASPITANAIPDSWEICCGLSATIHFFDTPVKATALVLQKSEAMLRCSGRFQLAINLLDVQRDSTDRSIKFTYLNSRCYLMFLQPKIYCRTFKTIFSSQIPAQKIARGKAQSNYCINKQIFAVEFFHGVWKAWTRLKEFTLVRCSRYWGYVVCMWYSNNEQWWSVGAGRIPVTG